MEQTTKEDFEQIMLNLVKIAKKNLIISFVAKKSGIVEFRSAVDQYIVDEGEESTEQPIENKAPPEKQLSLELDYAKSINYIC